MNPYYPQEIKGKVSVEEQKRWDSDPKYQHEPFPSPSVPIFHTGRVSYSLTDEVGNHVCSVVFVSVDYSRRLNDEEKRNAKAYERAWLERAQFIANIINSAEPMID